MQIAPKACELFWREYLTHLPSDHPHRAVVPDAFAFGDAGAIADELADLALSGTKQATTSLAVEFTSLGEVDRFFRHAEDHAGFFVLCDGARACVMQLADLPPLSVRQPRTRYR